MPFVQFFNPANLRRAGHRILSIVCFSMCNVGNYSSISVCLVSI
uniref:Uncharacterized protein n=1 Tax=Arundo donax TaxID=35708 RepID=A0A0A9GM14_ARUDO